MFSSKVPKLAMLYVLLVEAAFLGVLPTGIRAQEIVDAKLFDPKAKFNESFDPTSAVSGGVIVGIKLGEISGNVDVKNIQLEAEGGAPFCVRAVTSDGRFSSNNKYVSTDVGATRLRISPVTSEYVDILSDYPARSFAVEAFLAKSGECVSSGAVHLPQVQVGRRTSNTLMVLINSSSRTVTMKESKSSLAAKCTPAKDTTRIAYDSECAIEVGSLLGDIAVFNIGLDDGFDIEPQTLSVALPKPTGAPAK